MSEKEKTLSEIIGNYMHVLPSHTADVFLRIDAILGTERLERQALEQRVARLEGEKQPAAPPERNYWHSDGRIYWTDGKGCACGDNGVDPYSDADYIRFCYTRVNADGTPYVEPPPGAASQPSVKVASPEGTAGDCQARGTETPEQLLARLEKGWPGTQGELDQYILGYRLGQSEQPTPNAILEARIEELREIVHWTDIASFQAAKVRLCARLAELRAEQGRKEVQT